MSDARLMPEPIVISIPGVCSAVAGALVVSAALIAGAIAVFVPGGEQWRGFAAGVFAMVVAALASILPLVVGGRFGLMGVVGGFFAAAFVRATVAIGVCMAAIALRQYPATTTLLTMAVLYLAVLAAETAVVARAIWNKAA